MRVGSLVLRQLGPDRDCYGVVDTLTIKGVTVFWEDGSMTLTPTVDAQRDFKVVIL